MTQLNLHTQQPLSIILPYVYLFSPSSALEAKSLTIVTHFTCYAIIYNLKEVWYELCFTLGIDKCNQQRHIAEMICDELS